MAKAAGKSTALIAKKPKQEPKDYSPEDLEFLKKKKADEAAAKAAADKLTASKKK